MKKKILYIFALFGLVLGFCVPVLMVQQNTSIVNAVDEWENPADELILYPVGRIISDYHTAIEINKVYTFDYLDSVDAHFSPNNGSVRIAYIHFSGLTLWLGDDTSTITDMILMYSGPQLYVVYTDSSYDDDIVIPITSDFDFVPTAQFSPSYITQGVYNYVHSADNPIFYADYQGYLSLYNSFESAYDLMQRNEDIIADLESDIETLRANIGSLISLRDSLYAQISELEAEGQEKTEAYYALREQYYQLLDDWAQADNVIQGYLEAIESLENMNLILETRLESLQDDYNAVTGSFGLIKLGFTQIVPLFDMEIGPNLTIGMLVTIPLVIGIVSFAIKLIG